MKTNKNYKEYDVVAQLSKKSDISINGRIIQILSGKGAKGDIGIKSRGKIDFLIHYCGYMKTNVTKFS